jgi:hypothetical protein
MSLYYECLGMDFEFVSTIHLSDLGNRSNSMVFVCLSFNPRNILFEVHAPKQENEFICVFVCLLGGGGGVVDMNFVSTNRSNSVVFFVFHFI